MEGGRGRGQGCCKASSDNGKMQVKKRQGPPTPRAANRKDGWGPGTRMRSRGVRKTQESARMGWARRFLLFPRCESPGGWFPYLSSQVLPRPRRHGHLTHGSASARVLHARARGSGCFLTTGLILYPTGVLLFCCPGNFPFRPTRSRVPHASCTPMLARAVPFPVAVAPVVASSRVSVPNAVFVSLHTPRATSVRARLRSLLPGLGDRARLGACAGRSALRCTLPRVPVSQRRVARSASITMINTTLANDDSLFIGLDFGTSGARCVVIDADCNVVAETSAKYPPIADGGLAGDGIPVGGWAEAWQGALWELIDALPDHIRNKVKAIAVDGTSGTALVVDGASNEVSISHLPHSAD